MQNPVQNYYCMFDILCLHDADRLIIACYTWQSFVYIWMNVYIWNRTSEHMFKTGLYNIRFHISCIFSSKIFPKWICSTLTLNRTWLIDKGGQLNRHVSINTDGSSRDTHPVRSWVNNARLMRISHWADDDDEDVWPVWVEKTAAARAAW